MPNTKLNKQRLSNHFHYNRGSYLFIILASILISDLLFTITAYQPPSERKVDIEVVSAYADIEALAPYAKTALEDGIAYELARDAAAGIDVNAEDYEVPLEEVNFLPLGYDPNGDDAYYTGQKYMVTLAAQEGDIFILSRDLMEQMVREGLAIDLTPYIESGIIDPGERDLSRVTYPEYYNAEEGETFSGNNCIYALQVNTMTGLKETARFDISDKYMVIMVYSQNKDTSAAVMQSLIDQFETNYVPAQEQAS